MKILAAFIILTVLFSCGISSSDEPILNENKTEANPQKGTLEERINSYVKVKLSINATEEFTIEKDSADLNGDKVLDYIVTINLLNRAMKEAAADNTAKRAELGYLGPYNYFFFMDGKTGKMSAIELVQSSPLQPLHVGFDYITTDQHKDFYIDFHRGTALWRSFYKMKQGIPKRTGMNELFINLNKEDEMAYCIELVNNDKSVSKIIAVYEAKLEKYKLEKPMDIFQIEPERTKTDKLARVWYYNEKTEKYFMRN